MRPIPAPRIGESHGLLRAISQRDRIRLEEFVTEFPPEELFPPGLENAMGRTRQFVSYARAAGLVKEDRGTVELTEIGKRYVRAGDQDDPFTVSDAQADWLRRQLLEKHMTDSIFHGLAIGLSLLSSVAPGTRISMLDFGRALGYLGRAGWDNDNTLAEPGRALPRADARHADDRRAARADLGGHGGQERADAAHPHVAVGHRGPAEPGRRRGGPRRGRGRVGRGRAGGGRRHRSRSPSPRRPRPAPAPAAPPTAAAPEEEDEWQDVGPGSYAPAPDPEPAPPLPRPAAAPPATPAHTPAAAAPPTPPADIWETAEPDEKTSTYTAVGGTPPVAAPEPEPPAPAAAEPAPPAVAPAPPGPEPVPPAPEPARPQDAATVISGPAETAPRRRPPRRAWRRRRRPHRAPRPRSSTRTRSAPPPRARGCGCRARPTRRSPPRCPPAGTSSSRGPPARARRRSRSRSRAPRSPPAARPARCS